MKWMEYVKDRWVTVLVFGIFMGSTLAMMKLLAMSAAVVILYAGLAVLCFTVSFTWEYVRRRKFYNELVRSLERLNQKYLVLETLEEPNFYEGKIQYETLYEVNKSMAENVIRYAESVNDFKEYIEMWVHEVKLPIASLLLMCHNNRDNMERKYVEQIRRLDNYTDQVLYYVRSENAQEDYLFGRISLKTIVNKAAVRNKDTLLEQQIDFVVHDVDVKVLTDGKWMEFILNQIVNNSIKYQKEEGDREIVIWVEDSPGQSTLHIRDNGIGVAERDLPRVFHKSFTGENGRKRARSTGMGLYIAKKLCDRMGHRISMESVQNEYADVQIVFYKDDYFKPVT